MSEKELEPIMVGDSGAGIDALAMWRDISTAPKDGANILLLTGDGRIESGNWIEKEEDQVDQMGSDAGWMSDSGLTFPGRSFGNPEYYSEAIDPPTHWMPRPKDPAT